MAKSDDALIQEVRQRISLLEELCRQAAKLRDATADLCGDLTKHIERTRRALGLRPPHAERRRRPR